MQAQSSTLRLLSGHRDNCALEERVIERDAMDHCSFLRRLC